LTPITGLSVALCGCVSVAAALVGVARRWDPDAGTARRFLHLGGVSAVSIAVLLLPVPALRSGITHGLTALGAANPWYADVGEFSPVLFGGQEPWTGRGVFNSCGSSV